MQIKPFYSQFLVNACVLELQNATQGRRGWVLWKTRQGTDLQMAGFPSIHPSIHSFIHSFIEFLLCAWHCALGTRNTDASCNEASFKETTLQLADVNHALCLAGKLVGTLN